jgi:hypothetical protein
MLEEFFQICSVKKRNLHMRIFFCSLVVTFRASTAAKNAKDWSLPSFGSHLNPISTRGGGRLCPPYTGVLGWRKFAVAALTFIGLHIPTHTLSCPITTTTVSMKFPKVSQKINSPITTDTVKNRKLS